MRLIQWATALFATGAAAQAYSRTAREVSALSDKNATVVPNSYILEVKSKSDLKRLQDHVKKIGGKITRTFESDLFTGITVESKDDTIHTLQDLAPVVKAWPNTIIRVPEVKHSSKKIDPSKPWTVHKYTGVDKAHAAGIKGKGAVVAIVDTGTEYTHPALGGCFGKGCKVTGGYDFVGDKGWDVIPDKDPMDHQGHGTHVAGILAGKTDNWTGVAPDATILSYKVFGSGDGTDESFLMNAFLTAYLDGADIITSSIGGPSGFTDNAWAELASRLVDAGVFITIAAGNDGLTGPFYGSNGALGQKVLAVASVEAKERPAQSWDLVVVEKGKTTRTKVGYLATVQAWDTQDWPIISLSLDDNAKAEGCKPFPEDTPDLSKQILLIRNGGCDWQTKQANLAAAGAQYVLVYNNDDPMLYPTMWTDLPWLAMIEKKTGEAIIQTLKAGSKVYADFTKYSTISDMVGVQNSAGGLPNYFTSWGPAFDMTIKPDIAAPGGSIFSTWIDNSWAVLDGTSMATPYVAGVAALWVSKYGGRNKHGVEWAKQLADNIVSSGAAVPWNIDINLKVNKTDYYASVAQVGAGQVDAWKVLSYNTKLSFDKFNLNDTAHLRKTHKIQIQNTGKKEVSYKFSVQPAGGFFARAGGPSSVHLTDLFTLEPMTIIPDVKLPSGTFKVKPGKSKTAQFDFKAPGGLDQSQLPIYSGKILITSSEGEEVSVPYLGGAFDLKNEMKNNALFSGSYPECIAGINQDDVSYSHSFTFNTTIVYSWDPSAYDALNFPKITMKNTFGSTEVRWDLFEAGWKEKQWSYPPIEGKNGYLASLTYHKDSGPGFATISPNSSPEDVSSFPVYDTTRIGWDFGPGASYYFWWTGVLANGSFIAPGNYTWRFAALLPFGDPKKSEDWAVYKFHDFNVPYLAM